MAQSLASSKDSDVEEEMDYEAELTDLGELTWGGSYKFPFQPRALRFDAQSGYVYHPSPPRPQSRTAADRAKRSRSSSGQALKASDAASPYGAYSLLCSNLVLSRLSDGLDLDITGEPQSAKSNKDAPGGSIEYQGKRYPIRLLRPQDAGPWSALRPSTRP
ncbi:hypothetical protein CBOM_03637 [Ceraceosorus bombacis]|uniref:Uncharacterized protein n=1 Tax=Ceraceosorus bombacis TaxID=401625 RepID=A0A0P1BI29_9BASI|nr:hypothetical protein CBOM_03637 [Ceraceosorus bombacis]